MVVKEEKTFANVDDLLMSDSEDDTDSNSKSAADNLNENDEVITNDDGDTTEFSDNEFEINDLGSNNLIQQVKGTPTKDRSECKTCGRVLPTPRLAQHESLPHPLACTVPNCDKRFVLVKTLERHVKKAHTSRPPTPGLVSNQLSVAEDKSPTTSPVPQTKPSQQVQSQDSANNEENNSLIRESLSTPDVGECLSTRSDTPLDLEEVVEKCQSPVADIVVSEIKNQVTDAEENSVNESG